MKNSILKIYMTTVCLFTNLLIFAEPGEDSEAGNLKGGDAPAPIGDHIWVLEVLVIVYAFWKIKASHNTRIQD
jgi:hypothetical protein